MSSKEFFIAVDTGLVILILSVLLSVLRRLSLINKNLQTLKSVVNQLDFYQRQILRYLCQETSFQLKESFPVSELIEQLDDKDTGF